MLFESKKLSLITLGITAIVSSRAMFSFFNDPEGPNLLIVVVAAVVIYLPSLAVYRFDSSTGNSKKFWLALLTQVLVAAVLYFLGVTF
jgi:hypothetical protein